MQFIQIQPSVTQPNTIKHFVHTWYTHMVLIFTLSPPSPYFQLKTFLEWSSDHVFCCVTCVIMCSRMHNNGKGFYWASLALWDYNKKVSQPIPNCCFFLAMPLYACLFFPQWGFRTYGIFHLAMVSFIFSKYCCYDHINDHIKFIITLTRSLWL